MVLVLFYFLNAPATTQSYSCLHTLSLHVALPRGSQAKHILPASPSPRPNEAHESDREWAPGNASTRQAPKPPASFATSENALRCVSPMSSVCIAFGFTAQRMFLREIDRSEEHTSELQSIMRNSYAVFCL